MSSERYAVERATQAGVAVYTLRDAATGLTASVAPELGANCFRVTVPHRGRTVDLLLPPPDFEALRNRPTGWGTPVLFPFPNRIRHGRFEFGGRPYQLEPNTPQGHHIHGLVISKPFQVERAAAGPPEASLTCVLVSQDFADIARQYPFPFVLRLQLTVRDGRLSTLVDVHNAGTQDMPMGFGTHPYYSLPLVAGGERAACRIQVPAARYWELDPELIPTGRTLEVEGVLDLRAGRALDGETYDHIFTALEPTDRWTTCRLEDPQAGLALVTRAQHPTFREWVVYAPRPIPTICFEPYTSTTNAPNLQAQGIDAGLVGLPAGERWHGQIETWAEPLEPV
jgi:aldose 1-epimerase